jgi:hypothetical protein
MPGRSIRFFLVDGTPQGLRTIEVGNWTGKSLVCPRVDIARRDFRDDAARTGVYFLLGDSDSSPSGFRVYVGEADDVWQRLTQHDDKKEFWDWVVVFVSKDDNLTKAHVRWLEATLVRRIKAARSAELENLNDPAFGSLPKSDVSDLETYLEHLELVLPTIGVRILSESPRVPANAGAADGAADLTLTMNYQGASAECIVVGGKFVVRKGSLARDREVESLGKGAKEARRRLRDSGVLQASGTPGMLVFAQDFSFDSISAAAAAVSGTGLNGRINWFVKGTEQSYKDWEEAEVAKTEASGVSATTDAVAGQQPGQ